MNSIQSRPHIPVMLDEVMFALDVQDGGVYLDCTFGAGGYSRAILSAADCTLHAIDCDANVERYANQLKLEFYNEFQFHNTNFKNIELLSLPKFDGVVFDLGMSSMQIDDAKRGFSFQKNGDLDMRMSSDLKINARYVVNHYSFEDLSSLIYNYGGEQNAKKISRRICEIREKSEIKTTKELADIVESVSFRRGKIHPATKTFQAIRIEVNSELDSLESGLRSVCNNFIKENGNIAVVSFHSEEDRIAKKVFNEFCLKKIKINKYSNCKTQHDKCHHEKFTYFNKKVIKPSYKEIQNNPRARSAKLRVITKCI
ncbi:MAG: 16S rRNA (cytosine(1402)-N(4))-methyltransferase RsmH [Proteobacteria bacterium]|nr:16S rRNA (cytosine(1402)-N(4))-methyltransferase RsmH [Pseudomonadota bacterium]